MENPFDTDYNIIPEAPPLDANSGAKGNYKFPSAEGFEVVPADWEPTPDRPVPALRCTHERDDGSRCKKFGVRGTGFNGTPAMCFIHGGSLPAVKAKAEATVLSARMRLIGALPMALDTLLDLAENATAEQIKLKAATEILDRSGVKGGMDITVEVNHTSNPSDDILKRLQIMRERGEAAVEAEAEELVDEGEKQADAPIHVKENT